MLQYIYIYIYIKIYIYILHIYIIYIYIYIYPYKFQLLLAWLDAVKLKVNNTYSHTHACGWLSYKASSYLYQLHNIYSYMALDSLCNTCDKSVSYRNYIECNLCFTQTHFKCNNLTFRLCSISIVGSTGYTIFLIFRYFTRISLTSEWLKIKI